MSISWDLLKSRVLRVLDDIERDDQTAVSWTDDDLSDYINEALVAISGHTAAEITYSVAAESEVWSVELPDDFMGMGTVSVIGTERVLLTPRPLTPGAAVAAVGSSIVGGNITSYDAYYMQPRGTVKFLKPVPAGQTIQVDYFAYWGRVESENDILRVPRWMEEPLKWYCLYDAMAKPAIATGKLANFKTKQDQGNPTQNPQLELAKWFKRRYEEMLSEVPPQDRTGWEA